MVNSAFKFSLALLFLHAQPSVGAVGNQKHPNIVVTGDRAASTVRADFGRVSLIANALARELSEHCAFAPPADQAAFVRCKAGLYRADSSLRRNLPDFVLWGRIRDPQLRLSDTTLTQFGKDVFTATYLPLFMFNGKYDIQFDTREQLYRIEFTTAFRNRLRPGEFPYPFWHDENKWQTYQGANRLTVWVGNENVAGSENIRAIQFSTLGEKHAGVPPPIPTPAFEKDTHAKWLWTDAEGRTQPQVTLFDGFYRTGNPHLKRLDETYRAMALELRNGECLACHVPDNPDKMKRLVLLQTPAHAASEISRVIESVRKDKMPLDEIGLEKPMPQDKKSALLDKAIAFDAALREAKDWELRNVARKSVAAKVREGSTQ